MNPREELYKNNRVSGLSQYKSAKDAGYADSTSKKACRIEKRVEKDIQEALESAGITTEFISKKLYEKASSDNEMIQLRALELISKLRKYLSDITVDQSSHYTKVTYEFKEVDHEKEV